MAMYLTFQSMYVRQETYINGPCFVKILADSGKGSFKVSLIAHPHDYNPKDDPDYDSDE